MPARAGPFPIPPTGGALAGGAGRLPIVSVVGVGGQVLQHQLHHLAALEGQQVGAGGGVDRRGGAVGGGQEDVDLGRGAPLREGRGQGRAVGASNLTHSQAEQRARMGAALDAAGAGRRPHLLAQGGGFKVRRVGRPGRHDVLLDPAGIPAGRGGAAGQAAVRPGTGACAAPRGWGAVDAMEGAGSGAGRASRANQAGSRSEAAPQKRP